MIANIVSNSNCIYTRPSMFSFLVTRLVRLDEYAMLTATRSQLLSSQLSQSSESSSESSMYLYLKAAVKALLKALWTLKSSQAFDDVLAYMVRFSSFDFALIA